MLARFQLIVQISQKTWKAMIGKVDKSGINDRIMSTKSNAEVAELADALRSGRSELTLVWVQIPPPAQYPRNSRGFCYLIGLKPFGL
jgi:hypothetical protein